MSRLTAFLALALWAGATLPDHHQVVAGENLEPGGYHMLRARTPLRAVCVGEPTPRDWWVRGGLIRVLEVVERNEGSACYRVKWIKPQTIGDHDDLWGLVHSRDLAPLGVFLSY